MRHWEEYHERRDRAAKLQTICRIAQGVLLALTLITVGAFAPSWIAKATIEIESIE